MSTVYPQTVFAVAADNGLTVEPDAGFFSSALDGITFAAENLLQFVLTPWEDFAADTNRLLDEDGNPLIDESGDYITW